MAKKRRLLLFCVLFVVLLTACAGNSDADSDPVDTDKYENLSVDDIPSRAEYLAMTENDQVALRLAMDEIPTAEYERLFEQAVTEYCASDAVPDSVDTVELVSVTVEKDSLSLFNGQNKKSLDNLKLFIEIKMEPVDYYEYANAASENNSKLLDYLMDHYFSFNKAREFVTKTTSEKGYRITVPGQKTTAQDYVFQRQPESEYAVQTLAYRFAEKNAEFHLQKFGALPNTKELYIEYYVDDKYFGEGQELIDKQTENLENICSKISEMVMREEVTAQYMEENGLTSYVIAFYNGVLADPGCRIFRAEYNK